MTKIPLTKKKATWAKGRAVNLRGNKLAHNASLQEKYQLQLHLLVQQMTMQSQREIHALFKKQNSKDSAMDSNIGSQARILLNYLENKFTNLFARKAKNLAEHMFKGVDKTSTTNLHSSLKQLSGGLSLKTGIVTKGFEEIATATIAENVSLIKSIPQEYFKQVTGSVMRSITQGAGVSELIPEIQKYDGQTYRRAKNIALDQTRKAYNTINANRLQALGVTHFEWLHSAGSASPRESHMKIDGMIFSFENLEKEQEAAGVPKRDRGLPSIPPNCFLGNTEVSLSNGCRNLWRYRYKGTIATIVLQSNSIIECTLNHPILTLRGWLAANEIQEMDYLISNDAENERAINNDKTHFKPTFDDLFISFSATHNSQIGLGFEFNFHGDIPKSQVDIISINNQLPDRIEIMNSEQIEKFILSLSNVITDFISAGFMSEIVQSSGTSSTRQFFTLIDSETFHSYFSCGCTIPQKDSILIENSIDSSSSRIKGMGEAQGTFAVFISLDNDGRIRIDYSLFSSSGQYVIESFFKTNSEFTRANFMNFAKFNKAHTGIKFLNRIKHKIMREFEGHVYTLESYNGWFNVTSTEIISKNCKCTILPIIDLSGD